MSILQICCVFDSAANMFNRPFYVPHIAMATRSFRDQVNKPDETNELYRHPEDFALYSLGQFEEETATFELHARPELIIRAKDIKDAPQ